MKRFSKIICVCLSLLMLIGVVPFVSAETTSDETIDDRGVEVVLLFDVSGSMNNSDPETRYDSNAADEKVRLSIRAAKQLASLCPGEKDFFITVVPYNSLVYELGETYNVKTLEGKSAYNEFLNEILSGVLDSNGEEFECWNYQTNTGRAFEIAKEKLEESPYDTRKAVIHFTDGRPEVSEYEKDENGNYVKDENGKYIVNDLSDESRDIAISTSNELKGNGVSVFSVGLNVDGNVNKNFLNEVSGETGYTDDESDGDIAKQSEGFVEIVNDAASVSGAFSNFFAKFFPNGQKPSGAGNNSTSLKADEKAELVKHIYGQAVKEANFTLSSSAPLKTVLVKNPDGDTVLELDMSNRGDYKIDDSCCELVITDVCSVVVKLNEPADGDWVIEVTGEKGVLCHDELYYCELELKSKVSTDVVCAGDSLKYDVEVYNSKTSDRLDNPSLFDKNEGAKATVKVKNAETNKPIDNIKYKVNLDSKDCKYSIEIPFGTPGKYIVTTTVEHNVFKIEDSTEVTILGPTLQIETSEEKTFMGSVKIDVSVYNTLTNEVLQTAPEYMKKQTATLKVYNNYNLEDSIDFKLSKINDGKYTYTYTPDSVGNYKFVVESKIDGTQITSNEVSVEVLSPIFKLETSSESLVLGPVDATFSMYNPVTNEILTEIPTNMQNSKVTLTVNGVDITKFKLSELVDGKFTYTYTPSAVGNFTFVAMMAVGENNVLSNEVTVAVNPSEITVDSSAKNKVSHSGMSYEFSESINLAEIFKDSDGDELTYSVTVTEGSPVTAVIEGTTLVISANNFGKGVVTVAVSDGKGADITYDINVKVSSMMPLLIGIIIAIVAVIIIVVVLIIIIKKKSVIDFVFKVKLEVEDEYGNANSAVYRVSKLSARKNAKGTMTLKDILTRTGFASLESSTIGDSELDTFIAVNCGNIILTGIPFKHAFKVVYKGKKEKKYTFTSFNVNVALDDGKGRVVFGKQSAEF